MPYALNLHHVDTAFASSELRPTWSWLDWRPSKGCEENIICFSSGWGDGSYASYFGFDADGRPSALVTDFAVLFGKEAPPRPKAPWWQFWKQS